MYDKLTTASINNTAKVFENMQAQIPLIMETKNALKVLTPEVMELLRFNMEHVEDLIALRDIYPDVKDLKKLTSFDLIEDLPSLEVMQDNIHSIKDINLHIHKLSKLAAETPQILKIVQHLTNLNILSNHVSLLVNLAGNLEAIIDVSSNLSTLKQLSLKADKLNTVLAKHQNAKDMDMKYFIKYCGDWFVDSLKPSYFPDVSNEYTPIYCVVGAGVLVDISNPESKIDTVNGDCIMYSHYSKKWQLLGRIYGI